MRAGASIATLLTWSMTAVRSSRRRSRSKNI